MEIKFPLSFWKGACGFYFGLAWGKGRDWVWSVDIKERWGALGNIGEEIHGLDEGIGGWVLGVTVVAGA
ncbi:unnamed protein product [Prunus armeniaca]|uniref:Uncharacterized protein n=1 Tax=Prunus armeniaca TaxID=36596 RepID=A0A6J5WQP8_PRUAR|nr:unnamed protein product [Prunus armeniaca]CAB4304046.1 unnamed protein product [Prunus armeniaca]